MRVEGIEELPKALREQARRKLQDCGKKAVCTSSKERGKGIPPILFAEGVKEDGEQEALFDWAALMESKFPELKYMHHVPNSGKRGALERLKMKATGLKSGVPDISLPAPKGKYHGLYIELKVGRNKATKEQKDWLLYLKGAGYKAVLLRGYEQAKHCIEDYLTKGECEDGENF